MGESLIALSLAGDLQSVVIRFRTNPDVELRLSAVAVDNLLGNLGRLRARMKPEVASEYRTGQRVDDGIPRPKIVLEEEALLGDPLLHLRDPRFGWLHYLIPAAEAIQVSDWLRAHAGRAQQMPPGRPN